MLQTAPTLPAIPEVKSLDDCWYAIATATSRQDSAHMLCRVPILKRPRSPDGPVRALTVGEMNTELRLEDDRLENLAQQSHCAWADQNCRLARFCHCVARAGDRLRNRDGEGIYLRRLTESIQSYHGTGSLHLQLLTSLLIDLKKKVRLAALPIT